MKRLLAYIIVSVILFACYHFTGDNLGVLISLGFGWLISDGIIKK